MALVDDDGHPAVAGKSLGIWLDEADFVFCGDDHENDVAFEMGRHSFPRDWPDVYEESEVLRSMLKKKGPCAAKRVSVVPSVGAEHKALVHGLDLRWLQSFANAESVKKKTGLPIVEGWAMYDLLDDVTGAAFAAERYWWNTTADGTWLDFSPRAENAQQLLLVEAVAPRPPKKPSVLTRRQLLLAERLLELRCPKARRAAAAAAVLRTEVPQQSAQPLELLRPAPHAVSSTEDLSAAVKRLRLGIREPLYQFSNRVSGDAELCEGLVHSGMCGALVGQLSSKKHAAMATRMLAVLAGAAVKGAFHKRAGDSLLAADGVEPLVEMLACPEGEAAGYAARALSHFCFQCSAVQERAAKRGAVRLSIRLLSRRQRCSAADAAGALWHLQVACPKNASSALSEGAATVLLSCVNEDTRDAGVLGNDEMLRLNALGALMPLATAPGARDELGERSGVHTLCTLIREGGHTPEVRWQAVGALMNLLSGHNKNCETAVHEDVIEPLIRVIGEEAAGVAREYAAGALANIVARGGPRVGAHAVTAGAFEALGGLLSAPSSMVEIFATLANLAQHLPEDRCRVLEADILQRMVVSMRDEEDPARCQALSLCMNLAPRVPVKAQLLKAGAVKPLVSLLESSEEELRERAAGALANLMDGHPETTANVFMEVPDLAKTLVYALETEYCGRIQRQMARAIGLLASRRVEPVRKAGGVEPLAAALEDLEEERAWEPALALMNLAPSGKEVQELVERGTIRRLVCLLEEPEAGGYAAGALANLSAGSELAASAATAAGALEPLLRLIMGHHQGHQLNTSAGLAAAASSTSACGQQVLEWAVGAVGNLVEYGGAHVRRRVVESGALRAVIQLLKAPGQSTVGQELALFTLGTVLKDERNRDIARESLKEAIDPLRDLTIRLYERRLRDQALSLLRLVK